MLGRYSAYLCVLGWALSVLEAQRIDENIPVSRGSHNVWAWLVQIVFSIFGVIYNSVCLTMLLSLNNSNKMSFYSINVCIIVIDLIFSFNRVLFGSIYYHYNTIVGGSIACFFEAFTTFTLGSWSLMAIIGMSWVARNDICNKYKVSNRQMIYFMLSTLVYCMSVCLLILLVPYGGYGVAETGTYCSLYLYSKLGAPILYVFVWLMPIGFLVFNIGQIYKTVKQAQAILDLQDIKEQAKGPYIRMVLKLGYFLFTTITFYQFYFFQSVYEWSTYRHVPPWYSGGAGLSALLVGVFVNPSLFFYLNEDLRDKFWELIGFRVLKYFEYILGRKLKRRRRILTVAVHPNTSNKVLISPNSDFNSTRLKTIETFDSQYLKNSAQRRSLFPRLSSTPTINHRDVNTWLSEPLLYNVFKEHGRKEYSVENLLFFEDVRKYYFIGQDLLSSIEDFICESNDKSKTLPDDIIMMWSELEMLGNRIYTLYVEAPSAPLEINLPANLRDNICNALKLSDGTSNQISNTNTKFPSLNDLFVQGVDIHALVLKYVHIYDESVDVVKGIIETDLWPRFIKSNHYQTTLANTLTRDLMKV